MAKASKQAAPSCSTTDVVGAIPLPLLDTTHGPRGPVRPSRNGRRRAIVLIIVQVLIVAHVIQWRLTGRTLSPIEPSEAMDFVKHGVVNAGLIFFVIALLSTLVLGRWFCGWGCHLVLLQDACGWLMKKCGVRPKPFRSRLLLYVPLGLALYMFLWPVVYRLAVAPWTNPGLNWPGFSAHLTATDFWATFPGLMLAVPFLLVCGFGTVYVLGAKGFCTYGCPYGGFFAPLDELAPGRIRVTDDCEQCGHCTAVCTSNVRVHAEVAAYGMVVDPGCMKCLDCVSVCPKDALHFGFGTPAVKAKPAREVSRPRDLTGVEEIVCGIVFAAVFFSVRGEAVRLPLLMSAGIAGIVAALVWKFLRVLRGESASFHRMRLKIDGRLRGAGVVYVLIVIGLLLLTLQSGVVNIAALIAGRIDQDVTVSFAEVFGDATYVPTPSTQATARRAIRWYRRSGSIADGGLGWYTSPGIRVRVAWLHASAGEYDEAIAAMARIIEGGNAPPRRLADMALLFERAGRPEDAARYRQLAEESARGSLAQ